MWALLENSFEGLKTRFSTRWDSMLLLIGGTNADRLGNSRFGLDSIGKARETGKSRRQFVRGWHGHEAEPLVIFSLVVSATTFEARDATPHRVHARQRGAAFAARIEVLSLEADALQRKIVAARFVRHSQ